MIDIIKIQKLSEKFVNENIDNPTVVDYMLFQNAMLTSATEVMEQVKNSIAEEIKEAIRK